MPRSLFPLAVALVVSWMATAVADESEGQPATAPEVAGQAEVTELSTATKAEHSDTTTPEAAAHKEDAGHASAAGADTHAAEHAAAGHEESGSHHDPYDLSHVNAGPQQESPDEFRSDLAIWTFVVFCLLLTLLGKFAWGPVMDGLEKREHSIAQMIEEAKQSQEKAAEQLKIYEAKLAAAGEEARLIVVQARQDAQIAGERILAEAEQAAKRERQRAVEDINTAKNSALQAITERSVDMAVGLAGRIVRRQLNKEDHAQLMREALEQLPSRN